MGLYIHIPFCQRKCSYCGFCSLTNQTDEAITRYIHFLSDEFRLRRESLSTFFRNCYEPGAEPIVDSVFIGGGTPSLVSGADINKMLDEIRSLWALTTDAEITMESNPNSINHDNLNEYRNAGVNRLSIGVQSFDDGLLAQLGRLHDAQCARNSVEMARKAGFDNINLDLMFGLPNQTGRQWMDTLQTAVSLQPEHLSLYTLQIEEETPLYRDYKSEILPSVDPDLDRACYHQAIRFLKKYGYEQYEISNFSKHGRQCRHNLKYWSMENYAGFGLNASSHIDGCRWTNVSDMVEWEHALSCKQLPINSIHTKTDDMREGMGIFLFTGLRKTQGISFTEFNNRFGTGFFQAYSEILERLQAYRSDGLLEWSDPSNGYLWLTEAGIDCSNEIMAEFV